MFATSGNPLPIPVEVVLATDSPLGEAGLAEVRLQRRRLGTARRTWKAVIVVDAPVPHDPDAVLAQAHGFLVDDPDGPVGVVEEVFPTGRDGDGTIVLACGWFGRRFLTLGFEDVAEIVPAERRLILRPGFRAVADTRHREPLRGARVRARLERALSGRLRRRRRAFS
jgi:hypothetical protein